MRPGFGELRVAIAIAGDSDTATLTHLAERGVALSPIRDSVEKGVRLSSEIAVQN